MRLDYHKEYLKCFNFIKYQSGLAGFMKKIWQKLIAVLCAFLIAALILLLPNLAWATPLANQVRDPMILHLWQVVLAIVNIAAILGLIFIAIVNILRINIETYNIRRLLPALILAIILANFSHLISRIMIDFAQVLTNFFIQPNAVFEQAINGWTVSQAFGFGAGKSAVAGAPAIAGASAVIGIVTAIVLGLTAGLGFLLIIVAAFILIMIPSLLVLILALLCYVRLYIIWFLVILSPIAFFGLMFEPMKGIWSFWWGWFTKWLFLAPVGFFFLRLAVEVGEASGSSIGAATGPGTTGTAGAGESIAKFATWIFGLGMVFMAMYVPFSWGQNVFNALKGVAARGAALGYRGTTIGRRAIGQRLAEAPPGSTRRRVGQWMGRDYGLAWQTRMKDLETFANVSTHSGGLTRRIAAGYQEGQPYNPADIQILQAEQMRMSSAKIAFDVENMSRGLDLHNVEQYNNPAQRRDYYRAIVARNTLAGMAIQNHQHDAFQSLQQRFAGVTRPSRPGEDQEFYDRVMTALPEMAHGHVEVVHGERHAETPESNYVRQNADNAEHHLTMNPGQLAIDQSEITNALSDLSTGNIVGAKARAKVLFRVMPEAEIQAMSPQQLAEQLHERLNSNQITSAMRTAGRSPEQIRQRVRVRAFQDYSVEQMAQNAGRLNVAGATRADRAAELAGRLQGTAGTAEEQQTARQAVVPHIEHVLDQVPQYRLGDEHIIHDLDQTGGALHGITNQARRRRIVQTERARRQTNRNTAVTDILATRGAQIAEMAENFREQGQFDRLNGPNINNRNQLINQIDTHIP
jgi:ribosomal protein L12E/L44/L45/RPP1/RPP2